MEKMVDSGVRGKGAGEARWDGVGNLVLRESAPGIAGM